MDSQKEKFGFWSIVLLGINAIVGTGIFLLPNKAYSIIGSASLGVLLFDALLAGCIALCFAEVAEFFSRNGGPYLYAKHALGDFWGFEVGVLKWIVIMIAWAAMSVGFATALGAAFSALGGDTIPIIAIATSLWILTQAQVHQLLWGLGGCIVIIPLYFLYLRKKRAGLIKEHDDFN